MGNTPRLNAVQAHSTTAWRCGFNCYHPEGSVDLCKDQLALKSVTFLTLEEHAAWMALSPAVWWVNFQRGWTHAERQAVADQATDNV